MKLKKNGIVKTVLLSSIPFLFLACSSKTEHIPEKKIYEPGTIVGVCGFIPNENFSLQKRVALQRAIVELGITEGIIRGTSNIDAKKLYIRYNESEHLYKNMKQNSVIKVHYKDIDYKVKIVDVWRDKETKEVFVRIKKL